MHNNGDKLPDELSHFLTRRQAATPRHSPLSTARIALVIWLGIGAGHLLAQPTKLISIARQGSFFVGGTVLADKDGNTFHGDHAYVEFQIPPDARPLPLVMWHGYGQSGKTWESTPDGREGFQSIFLRRGFAVYILDQPRRGRAGRTTDGISIKNGYPDEAIFFDVFRLGVWPDLFPGVQFSNDPAALEQFYRQQTPNTGPGAVQGADVDVTTKAASALFDTIGPAMLVPHSAAGLLGWLTAIKNSNVKAIIAYEPVEFVFAEGELPPPISGDLPQVAAVLSDFDKLTKIPIQIVFGDNIDKVPFWAAALAHATEFVNAVNHHGGNATLLHLPKVGIRGNTHFVMSDLNNLQIADLLSQYLHQQRLD